jgi:hypothetical protein
VEAMLASAHSAGPADGRQTCPTQGLRPLWLSEAEAEALISLCATSVISAGDLEHHLMSRLGQHLRAFAR